MTTSPTNLTELAQQGNPEAIATLMNRLLQPRGITAQVEAHLDRLQVRLESAHAPNQSSLVKFVYSGLMKLNLDSVRSVWLGGYQTGDSVPVWEEEIDLAGAAAGDDPLARHEATLDKAHIAAQATATGQAGLVTAARRNLPAVGMAAVLLLGLGAVVYSVLLKPDAPPAEAEAQPRVVESTPPAATAPTAPDSFRTAVNKAMQAAIATQTAATSAQWQQVAGLWQESIALLEAIPADDANHAIAQQKIGEYQRNLSYAQQQLQTLTP